MLVSCWTCIRGKIDKTEKLIEDQNTANDLFDFDKNRRHGPHIKTY